MGLSHLATGGGTSWHLLKSGLAKVAEPDWDAFDSPTYERKGAN